MSQQTEKIAVNFCQNLRIQSDAMHHAVLDRRAEEWIEDTMTVSGIPLRHLERQYFIGEQWCERLTALKEKLGTGLMVALVGGRGTGKTQMAVELMRHTIRRMSRRAVFTTAAKFIMRVKSSFGKDSTKTEGDVFQDFTKPKLLVIDEFGRRNETDWEHNAIFELLNDRYNAMNDTVLISNHDAAAFREAAGPSLISRMNECGGICDFAWPSFRDGENQTTKQ